MNIKQYLPIIFQTIIVFCVLVEYFLIGAKLLKFHKTNFLIRN